MAVRDIAISAAGSSGTSSSIYVDDVFSTYLYTGNGSTQTITNGIDLAGKGGLVWVKQRDASSNHILCDTGRGADNFLMSDATSAQSNTSGQTISAFSTTGFSVGNYAYVNQSTKLFTSWTFRKAPKFFDMVTFMTDGSGNATISHSLGQTPGMIIVKSIASADNWAVYHRSLTSTNYALFLNLTQSEANQGTAWISSTASTVTFSGSQRVFGVAHVAYLFAHDTAADGLIQCGSFTNNGSGNATVNLGWEPQFVMMKALSAGPNWWTVDTTRGCAVYKDASTNNQNLLYPNSSVTEGATYGIASPSATGFYTNSGASTTYVYMAIRRPNKPPTTGTQVYNAIARNGTNALAVVTGVGFTPDLIINHQRTSDFSGYGQATVWDRLRGAYQELVTSSTTAEVSRNGVTGFDVMDGYEVSDPVAHGDMNYNAGNPEIAWNLRRAPGVFDVVCYTGNGLVQNIAHGLGVEPELIIYKTRNATAGWCVYAKPITISNYLVLNTSAQHAAAITGLWNSTVPTSTVFTVNSNTFTGFSGNTYVAYLFATKTGISKVGSYTGNGSSQTINCGFSTGARFILIKRTDSTGDWYVWDSTRGIVAGNDPRLSLNTTAAEVTTDDSVDQDTTGFIVNQLSATNINVNAATYIYLALA